MSHLTQRLASLRDRCLRLLLGASPKDIARRIERLEGQLAAKTAPRPNPDRDWLRSNRLERMDPTIEGEFDPVRKEFHLARYEFAAPRVAGLRVGDIACGTGYGSALLKEKGAAAEVYGIDIDPATIAYAVRTHHKPGIRFRVAAADRTGLPDASLDLCVSFETIEHLDDDAAMVGELRRLLIPGGTLIISTPNNWPLDAAPYHRKVYTLESFRSVLSRRFDIREVYNQNSGSISPFNRAQPAGIIPTTEANAALAECFIAVCEAR